MKKNSSIFYIKLTETHLEQSAAVGPFLPYRRAPASSGPGSYLKSMQDNILVNRLNKFVIQINIRENTHTHTHTHTTCHFHSFIALLLNVLIQYHPRV